MADSQRKTANLWSAGNIYIAVGDVYKTANVNLPNDTYTFKAKYNSTNTGSVTIGFYDENNTIHTYNMTQDDGNVSATYTGIVTAIRLYSAAGYNLSRSYAADFTEIMLNTGSTPLPYEPYGWQHSLRKLSTATDTLTTLPADLYADGNLATVGLQGNMSQTGTPTPQNPIQPSETGERTGNLFDKSQPSTVGFVREDGTINENNNYRISDYIQLLPNTQYTVSNMNVNGLYPAVCFYTDNKTYISGSKYDGATVFTFTTPSNCKYVLVSYLLSLVNNVMLNTGSTALPYEPYGIKIPILNNSQTTNVYLGEVQSTRRIIKCEFNGSEEWAKNSASSADYIYYLAGLEEGLTRIDMLCSHLPIATSGISPTNAGVQLFSNKTTLLINVGTDAMDAQPSGNTVAGLKEYLAAQYAAGTPVCVWYILAESETAVVNEPLRKIGDYADEVSGITIPTIAGANTLSVDTTLQPSEVTATYKGWHPVQSVHERESGAWD